MEMKLRNNEEENRRISERIELLKDRLRQAGRL
jgi:hypothetical protein